ncbi:hypothetical protein ACS0TY_035823 [Phlomoides rotata]
MESSVRMIRKAWGATMGQPLGSWKTRIAHRVQCHECSVTELYHPLALRHFLLGTHYHALSALRGENETNSKPARYINGGQECITKLHSDFETTLADDLHTPLILNAGLPEAFRFINKKQQKQQQLSIAKTLIDLEKEIKQVLQQLKDKALRSAGVTEDDVLRSIEERMFAHKNKGFSKGDQIRSDLAANGIALMDVGKETIWRPCVPMQQEKPNVPAQQDKQEKPNVPAQQEKPVIPVEKENPSPTPAEDSIPPEIGELKQPTHLYLSFNNFKGEIPKELANLPELRYLQLHENRLIGRIPAKLGTLPNLRHLDVGNNHLIGTIRELIRIDGCFPALRNLYLNNNYLTVGIPSQLSNLTKLEILCLSYNKMSRVVPFGVAHIPRLTYLYLDHNQFSGRIPETFYKHPFLKEIKRPPRSLYWLLNVNILIDKGLKWGVRFQIIMGIRGLVYLHQDSGLRWLYASRVHYYGKISVKTVVYSFGIILKIANDTKYFPTEVRQDILEDVWKLWTEGRAIDLVDDSMDASGQDEVIRCIQVALLCIQEHPDQRPTMPTVIKMLEGNGEMMQPHTPANLIERTNSTIDGLDSNATFEFDDTLER